MNSYRFLLLLFFCSIISTTCPARSSKKINSRNNAFITVTDYIKVDSTKDVADDIQKIIDTHPNRTIFFPDGVYLLSHPIKTPADPTKAVHLVLSNFTVIKATDSWKTNDGALVRLGGKDPYNSITIDGSNYGLEGGIIDGNGIADGIAIESGRETRINHVSIKHVRIGIHILHGANSGSSDSDIIDVNIVGNNTKESIGVLIEGYDNTLTNMRIASVHTGIWCKTEGNSLRNIHPLYRFHENQEYESSCGFIIEHRNNWMSFCYSDQFATGFKLAQGICVNLTDCFAFWYNGNVPFQTAIDCNGPLEANIYCFSAGFSNNCQKVSLLRGEKGGNGFLKRPNIPNRKYDDGDVSDFYIKN